MSSGPPSTSHLTFEESEIHPMVVVIDERVAADATSEHALLRAAFEHVQQHDGVDAGDFAGLRSID